LDRRLGTLVACAALAAGCATDYVAPPAASDAPQRLLAVQRLALSPENGGELIAPSALRAGDIVLSASGGLTSLGVRALTISPVSHASIYIGDGVIVEAVGEGVRARKIEDALDEEAVAVAFRHPTLSAEQVGALRAFALAQVGTSYNYGGIVLQAPFTLQRRLCELPLVPALVRDYCVRGSAAIALGAGRNDRFFCSQLVLESYRRAGASITDADPRLISPRDILHMREGDVPSVRIRQALVYVGHLKFAPALQLQPIVARD
jgi:cell wall-associated NlpC family hydrolase